MYHISDVSGTGSRGEPPLYLSSWSTQLLGKETLHEQVHKFKAATITSAKKERLRVCCFWSGSQGQLPEGVMTAESWRQRRSAFQEHPESPNPQSPPQPFMHSSAYTVRAEGTRLPGAETPDPLVSTGHPQPCLLAQEAHGVLSLLQQQDKDCISPATIKISNVQKDLTPQGLKTSEAGCSRQPGWKTGC